MAKLCSVFNEVFPMLRRQLEPRRRHFFALSCRFAFVFFWQLGKNWACHSFAKFGILQLIWVEVQLAGDHELWLFQEVLMNLHFSESSCTSQAVEFDLRPCCQSCSLDAKAAKVTKVSNIWFFNISLFCLATRPCTDEVVDSFFTYFPTRRLYNSIIMCTSDCLVSRVNLSYGWPSSAKQHCCSDDRTPCGKKQDAQTWRDLAQVKAMFLMSKSDGLRKHGWMFYLRIH